MIRAYRWGCCCVWLNDRSDPAAFILFGVALMFLVRSFVEVDVINPYVVGCFLLYYAAGWLASPP